MDILATNVDKISFLNPSSLKSSANTYRSSTLGASYSSKSSSRKDSQIEDTVHYLSPATTRTTTEYEGDTYYQHFLDFRSELVPQPPDFPVSNRSSSISCDEPELQRTLAIIKPDAMKYKDVVLRAIKESGLKILDQRLLHLSPEQVSDIYAKHYGSVAFPHMVVSMNISPLTVLSLAGSNCVEKWKTMVGPYGILREEWFFPYSVRTRFGILPDIPDMIHASENVAEAKWENRYFYPRSILEPIIIEEERVTDYVTQYLRETLLQGLIKLVKVKPVDPILFLAEWLLLNNPYQPRYPKQVALSPL